MTIETNRSPSTNSRAPPTSPFTNTGAPTHVWVTIFSSIFVFVRVEGWWGPNGKIPCYRNLPYKPSLDIAPMKFYKYVFSNSYNGDIFKHSNLPSGKDMACPHKFPSRGIVTPGKPGTSYFPCSRDSHAGHTRNAHYTYSSSLHSSLTLESLSSTSAVLNLFQFAYAVGTRI